MLIEPARLPPRKSGSVGGSAPNRRPTASHSRALLRFVLRSLSLLLLLAVASRVEAAAAGEAENLRVLDFWQSYSDAPNALYKDLIDDALVPLRERQERIARLRTRSDWQQYQRDTHAKLLELVGPFPEKTPLHSRALGVVQKDGFRVEKIVYESQPRLFVTAALFIPDRLTGRAPAILYCSGHTPLSFHNPVYQHVILNLVQRGFVVLAFDPINQGERLQFLDPETGKSEIAASGLGHSHAGAPAFVLGSSLARLMIWDGIRGLDYLVSREEVDPRRLGVTGRSGGGTQTAYIAAIDERVLAAAPENYITNFEHLLKSRGPQDAEQNFYREISRGFDQGDFVIARAPKPTLILATTRDIFSIEGTHTAFAEARRAFEAFGHPEAMAMSVDDDVHASTRKNREATYAFFQQHLGLPGDSTDIPVEPLTAEELRITATGQVTTSLGGETILSLNQREAARLGGELDENRRDLTGHLAVVKAKAAELAGHEPAAGRDPAPIFSGRYQRDGYTIEKHLLPVDERYAIPLLAMMPAGARPARVVLYLHPEGKAAAAGAGGEMEWFVRQGCAVVAPDIIGTGELGPGFLETNDPTHGGFRTWFGYVLMGKSIVGRQMRDVLRTMRFIEQKFGTQSQEVAGVARGSFAALLLHTAAIEGGGGRIALLEPLLSYESLVSSRRYPLPYLQSAVPAALTAYDLPDLAACLAPRKLLLADACDGSGARADAAAVARETEVIVRAFAASGDPARFSVFRSDAQQSLTQALADWLK